MPLDHFVSQVHLKNFYAPALNKRKMYAFRKSRLDKFPCDSRDVCRITDGSTNDFLRDPRLLEDFLKLVEPEYNRSAQALADSKFGQQEILVISGFAAFVLGCSPTAMRLGVSSLNRLAEVELELIEAMDELPPVPPELGAATAAELIKAGKLRIDTDPKFPQGMGISQLPALAKSLASFHWEIIRNPVSETNPFLTSDFPIAYEDPGPPAIRVIPLRPNLAVRIHPVVRANSVEDRLSDFRYRMVTATPNDVRKINRSIVQCAEDFVFSPVDYSGIGKLVKKYANYRLELDHTRVYNENGYMLMNTVRARASRD